MSSTFTNTNEEMCVDVCKNYYGSLSPTPIKLTDG